MIFGKVVPGLSGAIALLLATHTVVAGGDAVDWRLELLAEEGVPAETAALLKFQESHTMSAASLEKMIGRLGADEFVTREQAEREILLMGKEVLPSIQRLPRSDDPEVRVRLTRIEKSLTANGRWAKEDLLRQAVTSLLRERLKKGADGSVGVLFVELFRTPVPSLAKGFRKFRFQANNGMTGLVSNGVLRMKGDHAGDGDQELFLDARELTGKERFPDSFRIEVKLGGEAGGEGIYHVGVSVGNVRALYHPGYPTGGFRFERLDNHAQLTPNAPMGFDPPTGDLQRMSIDVKRHADGKVEMEVVVSGGDKSFRERRILEGSVVGKLDHIGLARSGRTGGDAVFDDLVVDLGIR